MFPTWSALLKLFTVDGTPRSDSYRDALQDDFDGSDGEVIHVIRRTPEVAQQVIEFDPVGGQVQKGILRQQHVQKDHSLKSKVGRYLLQGVSLIRTE